MGFHCSNAIPTINVLNKWNSKKEKISVIAWSKSCWDIFGDRADVAAISMQRRIYTQKNSKILYYNEP